MNTIIYSNFGQRPVVVPEKMTSKSKVEVETYVSLENRSNSFSLPAFVWRVISGLNMIPIISLLTNSKLILLVILGSNLPRLFRWLNA